MNANAILDEPHPGDLTEQIIKKLWPSNLSSQHWRVFAILDGARDQQIYPLISNSKRPYVCLYLDPLTDKLRAAAPYLIELDEHFTRVLLQKGWGASWGIYLAGHSAVALNTLRHQYRKINRVTGPAGKRLFFRYYDPRVLRVYLPTCYLAELQYFFDPVTDIFMEGDTVQSLLHFHHGPQGSLRQNVQLI